MRELENILKSLSALKDRIFHMLHQKRRSRVRRAFATALACVVVFVTTYGMILPAITLDDDVAEDMPGVFFEEMPDPDTFTPDESEEEFYFEEGWDADAEPAPEDEGVQDEEIYFKEQLLSGAIFQLLDQDKRMIENTIGNLGNVTLKDETVVNNAFTTDDKAPFEIRDLPNGSYVLREVQAPENYSIMEKDLSFKVKNGKAFDAAGNEVEELTYTVENASGVSLPETGGPGPNLLYLFGLMLMGLAGTGLVTRRRRRNAA